MTDLEMTKLCAQAVGLNIHEPDTETAYWVFPDNDHTGGYRYDPLHDDAQAMALFWWLLSECYKRDWELSIDGYLRIWTEEFQAKNWLEGFGPIDGLPALRRAIVECVVKMEASK